MSIAFLMFLLQEKSKVSVYYLFVKIARNCTYYTHVQKLRKVHEELPRHRQLSG